MTGATKAVEPQAGSLDELVVIIEGQLRATVEDRSAHNAVPVLDGVPAVMLLAARCSLTPFEVQVLLLGAAMELRPNVGGLCAELAGQCDALWATFRVAMTVFVGNWQALLPSSSLRRFHLVELGPGSVLTQRPLHIAERALHGLMGCDELDRAVACRVRGITVPAGSVGAQLGLTEQVHEAWGVDANVGVHVQCLRSSQGLAWAAQTSAHVNMRAWILAARDVPLVAAERDQQVGLWNREARLGNVALVVDLDERDNAAQLRAAVDFFARAVGPRFAVSVNPLVGGVGGGWLRLVLPEFCFEQRRGLWQVALPPELVEDAELDDLAARFELDAAQISQVTVGPWGKGDARQTLWDRARALARPQLEDLAQRVPSAGDGAAALILPPLQQRMLDAVVAQVRHKATVQHRWGLARRGSRGLGTSAVFSGPSGTGKTMAAESIASRLGLDLYRIDLSSVVSKYIGETEKNLRRVFDAAETGGAVLLFDEADALFGKRTEVKDSHDRHANIEVSYLLQRMECFGGLAMLTTNFRKAMDNAFLRRIQFIVEFPFPDDELRARMWASVFPPGVPTLGLNPARLGQLSVAGGNIQSIARNAAYLAADAGGPVTMRTILDAARLEADKLGRGLTPRELRGWPS